MKLPKKVVIVGAGPSGLFMAERLKALAEKQNKSIKIQLLEKAPVVGGKCHTYRDKKYPELRTEWGAGALAANYGLPIDAMQKYGLKFERMLPTAADTIEIEELFKHTPWYNKPGFGLQLMDELRQFDSACLTYMQAKELKTALPLDFEIPFTAFCEKRGWQLMPSLIRPLVPGFGYGDLVDCPAYTMMEYMGRTTLLSMGLAGAISRPPLLAIHGGFQTLMEKIAEQHEVKTEVDLLSIQRAPGQVHVKYQQNGLQFEEDFDCLVLANSPKHWPELGLEMTEIEHRCVEELKYYRYPVAVCRIKGLAPMQYFFPEALKRPGFGHVALITSRDGRENPEEGRLCTIYVNQLPGENHFDFSASWPGIVEDLKAVPGVEGVELLEEKYWEDYNPMLSWQNRLDLEAVQAHPETNTIYLGAYTLGGFEDVLSVANGAVNRANTLFGQHHYSPVEHFSMKEFSRAKFFFWDKPAPVYQGQAQDTALDSLSLSYSA